VAAFEAFTRALTVADAKVVTVLDGTIGGGEGKRPDIERRLAAARATAEATGLDQATLLGTANGAPVAALLAAQEPSRFVRLILYDTFPPNSKKMWAIGSIPDAADAIANLERLESELKTASAAWDWAQNWFTKNAKARKLGEKSLPQAMPPGLAASNVPVPPFGPPEGLQDGLAQLLQNVASLESPGKPNEGLGLSAITIPTVVIEVKTDGAASGSGGSLGMQVAAEIPNAIHRASNGTSRWPWGERAAAPELLTLGSDDQTAAPTTPTKSAAEPARILATVLFTDIVGSTERLTELGDSAWRELLARHHAAVRDQLSRFDGREIDTAGDGFLAAFEAPARAVRCAMAIRDGVKEIGLNVRCGLHTGECERVGDKLVGIAVHIGARIAGQASANEILVSSTVRDLVAGAGITFDERGAVSLKGLPGEWLLFAVAEDSAPTAKGA
jgi:class 3 adenylate cyclase